MKKRRIICLMFAIFLYSLILASVGVNAAGAKTGPHPHQSGDVKELEPGKYLLYDNYAKFDGAIYEYDLEEFFNKSYENFYTYTITSKVPENVSVEVVDKTILKIIPKKPVNGFKVIITAEDTNGEVVTGEFQLKYVNAIEFMSGKMVMWIIVACIILVVLCGLNYCMPINGDIGYQIISDGVVSYSGDGDSVRGFRYRLNNEECSVTGMFHGSIGKSVVFRPDRSIYIKESEETIVRLNAIRLRMGQTKWIYADEECLNGVAISFNKYNRE